MSEVLFNEAIDEKLKEIEDIFRQSLEKILGQALNKPCQVSLEEARVFNFRAVKSLFPEQAIHISAHLENPDAELRFLLEPSAAAYLGDLMMMGDGSATFIPEEHLDAVKELTSQILGDYTTALSAHLEQRVTLGEIRATVLDLSPSDFAESNWVWSAFKITMDGERLLLKMMSHSLIHSLAAIAESAAPQQKREQKKAEVLEPEPQGMDSITRDMALLLDIELPIAIELGRTSLLIREILKLGPGSIVELDKLSGEPVDVYINDKRFASGEVVVIDENFGVRITELLRPDERLKALRE
jgi:flagellar motor switch protein FliN/FliY